MATFGTRNDGKRALNIFLGITSRSTMRTSLRPVVVDEQGARARASAQSDNDDGSVVFATSTIERMTFKRGNICGVLFTGVHD
ncbi:MAG: hypothetical protein KBG15_20350 [Kofleriaceae bacterium]|nr:hypothetical protein [Kofleriaceae bacterium]